MAKKSRRTRSTPRLSSAQLTGASDTPSLPRSEYAPVTRRELGPRGAPIGNNEEEYAHVVSDLKRIGILAGSILAVMIALSFILPSLLP